MSSLESRYRRLLTVYPRDHRAVHEDEMLGVLLATAKPGQRRPGMRETFDLLRGALLISARRQWRQSTGAGPDGLAIVSLLGPILLSAYAVIVGPMDGYEHVSASGDAIVRVYPWFIWVGWPLVLVASVLGWRRLALVTAWVSGLALPLQQWGFDLVVAVWFPLALVTAAALTWSPGPARGLAVFGWPRLACYLLGVGLLDAGAIAVYMLNATSSTSWPTAVLLWAGLVILVGAAIDLASPAGRRAAMLMAGPLAWMFMWSGVAFPVVTEMFFAVPVIALVCTGIVVWLIERRTPTAAPEEPTGRSTT